MVAKLGHKYTELAKKNKIFSSVSGDADKNYSDRGASLHKGDVLFIPFFWLARNSVILLGCELERCSPPGQFRCVEKGLWHYVDYIYYSTHNRYSDHSLYRASPTAASLLRGLFYSAFIYIYIYI